MKKFYSVLFLFLILLFNSSAVEAKYDFKDVKKSHWAYSSIQEVTKQGYFIGDENGNFKPDNSVTRAEFAVILSRLFDETERVDEPFIDVNNDFWGKDAIEEMLVLGIIDSKDYINNKFEPNKPMTRSELTKWFTNALSIKQPTYLDIMKTIRDSEFTLIPVAEYLKGGITKGEQGYIGVMIGTELFSGYTDGTFKPNANASRAEIASLIIQYKNIENKEPSEFKGLNEIVEVSTHASNILSATKFMNAYDNRRNNVKTSVKDIANKKSTLDNKAGKHIIHRIIFVESYETIQETIENSIYAKMFFSDWTGIYYDDLVYMFVDQTLIPNIKYDSFTFWPKVLSSWFTYPGRLNHAINKFGVVSLPGEYQDEFFTKDVATRYWTEFLFNKKEARVGEYYTDDGSFYSFYSTY